MIMLTPDAAEVVRTILANEDFPAGTALRLGVTKEGCEGSGTEFRYVMDFDANPSKPDDHILESEGIRIVVDRESLPHLEGLQLGVRQKLGGVEFMFLNPKAQHSCGCGHTFSE